MISVVYCTRESNPQHSEHVKKTSGLANKIEVIEIVNKGESLTVAYNRGLKQATNDIVVFCHDDILFNSNSWGRKLLNHFKNSEYGILGIAGTTSMGETGQWWSENNKMVGVVKHSKDGKTWENKYSSNFSKEILEAVVVDGLFFAVNKSVIKESFNEDVKGFHLYDIDFCFNNYLSGVKIGVIFDVKITHMSIGETNDKWENNRKQFVEKYKEFLPVRLAPKIRYEQKEVNLKRTPKVSVIIPTKGNVDMLLDCIESIIVTDGYPNLEILIADTGSEDEDLDRIKDELTKADWITSEQWKLIEYGYYNFAKINNDVVRNHVSEDTELLLFSNNDIKLLNNALTQMVSTYLKKRNIGTIGCRLHFADNTVQHSGVIMWIRPEGTIGLSHKGLGSYYSYHLNNRNVLGNTAAFMLTPKKLFNQIGGFNEEYVECFEDVEYNVDCLVRNKENIFMTDAVAYHFESQTRNNDPDKAKREAIDINRVIPKIIRTENTWSYFENISKKQFGYMLQQQQQQQNINNGVKG